MLEIMLFGTKDRGRAARFRRSVELHELAGHRGDRALDKAEADRRAGIKGEADRREVGARGVRMIEQHLEHRRSKGEQGRLHPVNRAEHGDRIERSEEHTSELKSLMRMP